MSSETAFKKIFFKVTEQHEFHYEIDFVLWPVHADTDETNDVFVAQITH